MLLTYYTLTALAGDWDRTLRGARITDVWSQHRDELSIGLEGDAGEESTIVIITRPDRRLIFRNRGHGRARRHTASLFEATKGMSVSGVRTAVRDRMLFVDLGDRLTWQIALFGPRPNVWLVDRGAHSVVESFAMNEELAGTSPPDSRPAPEVADFETFKNRWPDKGSTERALSRAMPLFDTILARETISRAGLEQTAAGELDERARHRLFEEGRWLEGELRHPEPIIYWQLDRAHEFALIPLRHCEEEDLRAERFDSVDDAVRVFSHRALAQERFDVRRKPLLTRLRQAHERASRSTERMMEELDRPSRADEHERFGHLLMAQATGRGPGLEEVTLPDLMEGGEPVTISLDPALTAIENAQRYYDRARRGREARRHAEERWEDVHRHSERLSELVAELESVSSIDELDRFMVDREQEIAAVLPASSGEAAAEPFRRVPLPGGFEAWIGKHARGNAELITRHAGPHDLWLHARGFAGSHVVIRRPARDAAIPRPTVEAAAKLAAWYSKGRSSGLVPVQVAERKYVRPIKGGPPGAVRVEREEVLLVEPSEPGG